MYRCLRINKSFIKCTDRHTNIEGCENSCCDDGIALCSDENYRKSILGNNESHIQKEV